MKTLTTSRLWVLVCLLATACQQDTMERAQAGESCSSASDCDLGLICEDGACTTVCTQDSECPQGEVCRGRTCEDAVCGNGIIELDEACDNGTANSNSGGCLSDCTIADCGDGFLQAGVEDCDDGNDAEGDGCDTNCTETGCGNGVTTDGEECDDGNLIDDDGCDADCTVTICPPTIPNGTPCGDDGEFCNGPEVCQEGLCLPQGNPCSEDELVCTTLLCDEPTQSCNVLDEGYCLIDGSCYAQLALSPTDSCSYCDAEVATDTWQVRGGDLTFDGGANVGDAGTVVGDACGLGACTGGLVTCHPDFTDSLVCSTGELAQVEMCNRADDNCNGLVDEGFWGDSSYEGEDFPSDTEAATEINYTYPDVTMGDLQGKILPAGDVDIIRIQATEAETGFLDCIGSDSPFDAQLMFTAPDVVEFAWYYVCACWSDGDAGCLNEVDFVEHCVLSSGGVETLGLQKAKNCGTTDTGTLEIMVIPYEEIDYNCENWMLSWTISE